MEQRVQKPSLLGLCRVATEEGEANEEDRRSTYILSDGSDKVWLVDCGDVFLNDGSTGSPTNENEDENGRRLMDFKVEGVLLTHAHFDHIYGLPLLLEKFPDVAIYTNEWGKRALAEAKLNMSLYHETPVRIDCPNVRVVKEGDRVFGFDVYETPGHNPSCLCFANSEAIFTGDAYIPGCKVVTNLPHCDKTLAEASVARIMALAEGKMVCAGHEVTFVTKTIG